MNRDSMIRRTELVCGFCRRDLGHNHNANCVHNGIGEAQWVQHDQVIGIEVKAPAA